MPDPELDSYELLEPSDEKELICRQQKSKLMPVLQEAAHLRENRHAEVDSAGQTQS